MEDVVDRNSVFDIDMRARYQLRVSPVDGFADPFLEILAEDSLNKRGTGGFRSGVAVDLLQQIGGKCDRNLLFHTTIIPPIVFASGAYLLPGHRDAGDDVGKHAVGVEALQLG